MTTETNNAMTINMDDANLPTEGPAWEAMLEHVLSSVDSEVLYADVDPEWVKSNFDISDIYDEEEIIEAAGELQRDTINDYIWGRVKDICREENLPDHFCPVAITNELMTAIKLKKENDRLKAELEKEKEDRKEAHRVWTEHRHRLIEEIANLKKEHEKEMEDAQGQAYKDGWKMGWDGVDLWDGRYGENGGCNADWAEDANPRPQTTEEIAEMDLMKELADQFTAGKITMEQARKMYKKE